MWFEFEKVIPYFIIILNDFMKNDQLDYEICETESPSFRGLRAPVASLELSNQGELTGNKTLF